MAYRWSDEATIQSYLSVGASITIGSGVDDVSEASAELFENEAVDEVSVMISAAWEGVADLTTTTAPNMLKRLVAKLAAARIGTVRVGGNIGELPEWVRTFRNEVMAACQRLVINHDTISLENLTVRSGLDLAELLLKVKAREQGIVTDV